MQPPVASFSFFFVLDAHYIEIVSLLIKFFLPSNRSLNYEPPAPTIPLSVIFSSAFW